MKKSLIVFFILLLPFLSSAQDSIRVTFCIHSGMDCYGFPTMEKSIEHLDSLGRVTEVNSFKIEGCAGPAADSDFIPVSDMYYVYDSVSNIIQQTTNNYYGQDTSIFINTYTFDSWQNLTLRVTTYTYQQQTITIEWDSMAFDLNQHKIFELFMARNYTTQQLDTTHLQSWIYNASGKDSIVSLYSYMNFLLTSESYSYFYYDSLSRLVDEIGADSDPDSSLFHYQYDSLNHITAKTYEEWDTVVVAWKNISRELNAFDSLNLNTETRYQHWDSLTTRWLDDYRLLYQYDSLDRLIYIYNLFCSDSTCNDTMRRSAYTYDAAGHQLTNNSEEYDGNNWWQGTSGSHVFYTSFDDTLEIGSWHAQDGCDQSNTTYFDYNNDQQIVHTLNYYIGCLDHLIDCYYYNLNSDSLLVFLTFPTTACPFDTVHIPSIVQGGVPPYSYQWSPMVNVLDSNSASPRIVTDTTITYTLTVTDSLGHTNSSSATISVLPVAIRPVTLTSIGVPCMGTPYYLTFNSDSLSGGWDYVWYRNSSMLFNAPETLSVFVDGTYSVTISNNECTTYSNSVEVILHIPDTVHVTPSGNTDFCFGQSITLLADSFPYVAWSTGDTSFSINVNASGNYYAVSTDTNGCLDTSNIVSVIVHDNPNVYLGADTSICSNNILILDAGGPYAFYLWNDSTTLSTFQIVTAGNYFVSVTDSNGCEAADTVQVYMNAAPVINLGADTTICDWETILLDAGAGFVSYSWSDSSSAQQLNAFTTDAIDTNIYFVSVIDTNGCGAGDTIQVIFELCEGMNMETNTYQFTIYPNPAHFNFEIRFNLNSEMKAGVVSVLDVFGKSFFSQTLKINSENNVDVQGLIPGIYFVKLETEKGSWVRKLIVDGER